MKVTVTQIKEKSGMIPFKVEIIFENEAQTLKELRVLSQIIDEDTELDNILIHTELIETVSRHIRHELLKQGILKSKTKAPKVRELKHLK